MYDHTTLFLLENRGPISSEIWSHMITSSYEQTIISGYRYRLAAAQGHKYVQQSHIIPYTNPCIRKNTNFPVPYDIIFSSKMERSFFVQEI